MLRSSFRRLDTNGDKFLTMDEIIGTLTNNQESLEKVKKTQGFQTELLQFISQNDSDSNKKLDEDEFV